MSISPAEAAEILLTKPCLSETADGRMLIEKVAKAIDGALLSSDVEWVLEETLYQAALMSIKQGRPLDFGYIGTATFTAQ
ncbi:hypothetical protein CEW87_04080 [Parazoarcus communis]|uniref:Uncharacterized protein n=1 Tax=Parazoarcus communis TaxID=41977 RepID=A0A2U8GYC7_9RHOO|nr:hypothetical protein [Parazoarcus communis]AWI78611.1 hypothetical protein CEW87_04080 [Parazoarcus communis]